MPDQLRKKDRFKTQPRRISHQRAVNVVEEIEKFLIVCEGEKTEPNYFKSFKVPGRVVDVVGTGMNTKTLVDKAIALKEKASQRGDTPYDQVWCVFDRDSFPTGNFNDAIRMAEAEGFKVAYSNEAFELWYLLHFNYHEAAISRSAYIKKLDGTLKFKYEKNSPEMYDRLLQRQKTALKKAQSLLGQYVGGTPEENCPSTTVHLLVDELNKNTRR